MRRFRTGAFRAVLGLLAVLPVMLWAAPSRPGWTDDQDAAFAQAKAEKKLLLLDFTGSDWCPACPRMNREIFDTPEFKAYAKDRLVLMEVDFPNKPRSLQLYLQNERLRQEYGVEEFPAVIVLAATGKVVKTFAGYQAGGAKAFIRQLEQIR